MIKSYVIVEHRNSAAFIRMKEQVSDLQSKLASLQKRYSDLEMRYGNEIYYNAALCDLLRDNHIPFKQVFSHEYRISRFP